MEGRSKELEGHEVYTSQYWWKAKFRVLKYSLLYLKGKHKNNRFKKH